VRGDPALPADSLDSDGPQGTEAAAARLAAQLLPGDVVHVVGELGAGKTTFVRGACRALGVTVPVTSPTFAIAHRYPAPGGLHVAHLDLYRIERPGDEDPDLFADYLGADTIAFIEWPREDAPELPAPRVTVTLAHLGGDRRRIQWRPGP
jgi:tRNA threonylcarbamoyladenosine biosynthesis protein TsaE